MTDLYPQDWPSYLNILGVFLRLLGLFLLMPAFSHKAIPFFLKIMIALAVSLAIYPLVKQHVSVDPNSLLSLVGCALKETLIGCLMGFVASVTYEAISFAAHFIGMQIGLGTVSLVDPGNESGTSVLVPFYGWITLVLFFLLDLHLDLVGAFVGSFETTSSATFNSLGGESLFKYIVSAFYRLFVLALEMAAPFTLLSILVNVAMGILGRLMPQMNIFFLAFPVTILITFGALYVLAPALLDLFDEKLHGMIENIFEVLRVVSRPPDLKLLPYA